MAVNRHHLLKKVTLFCAWHLWQIKKSSVSTRRVHRNSKKVELCVELSPFQKDFFTGSERFLVELPPSGFFTQAELIEGNFGWKACE
jgi:hypothetical protein